MSVDIGTTLLGCAFFIRFWMQVAKAQPPFALSNLLSLATQWFVKPIRYILPGWFAFDFSSLIGGIFMAIISAYIDILLLNTASFRVVIFLTLYSIIHWFSYLLMGSLIIEAVLSWTRQGSPVTVFIQSINAPILNPIRRFVPTVARFDFSPVIAFLILKAVSSSLTKFILSYVVI